MPKRLLVGIATVVAAGAVAAPALAASTNAAQKEPMLDNGDGLCSTGATSGIPTNGFAVIKANSDGTISAEVSLKDAVPNATYQIAVDQTPSGFGCGVFTAGTLQTNDQGNGNTHVSVPIAPGSTDASIEAFTLSPCPDRQVTPDYVFGSK